MTYATLQTRADLKRLSEGDVRAALQKQVPGAAPGDVRSLAQVVVTVWDVVGALSEAEHREFAQGKDRLRAALLQAWRGRGATPRRGPIEMPVESNVAAAPGWANGSTLRTDVGGWIATQNYDHWKAGPDQRLEQAKSSMPSVSPVLRSTVGNRRVP
jgi:hypothetical protein